MMDTEEVSFARSGTGEILETGTVVLEWKVAKELVSGPNGKSGVYSFVGCEDGGSFSSVCGDNQSRWWGLIRVRHVCGWNGDLG